MAELPNRNRQEKELQRIEQLVAAGDMTEQQLAETYRAKHHALEPDAEFSAEAGAAEEYLGITSEI